MLQAPSLRFQLHTYAQSISQWSCSEALASNSHLEGSLWLFLLHFNFELFFLKLNTSNHSFLDSILIYYLRGQCIKSEMVCLFLLTYRKCLHQCIFYRCPILKLLLNHLCSLFFECAFSFLSELYIFPYYFRLN